MADAIDRYLAQLRSELRHDPLLARRLCEEVADHLAEIAAHERRQGMSEPESEASAVRRFGPPSALARQFDRFSFPLQALLACIALATAMIAVWLFFVVAVVLPARDPAHVPLWTAFAVGFLAYAALTLVFVGRGPRPAALAVAVVVLSLGAVTFGVYAAGRMVAAMAGAGGHFEGYLLVMGMVLAAHGLCALAYAGLTAAIARRIRAT